MTNERNSDDDRTDPNLGGEEPTNPGLGADDAFNRACRDLDRAVRGIATLARARSAVRAEGMRRFHWEMALMAGELGDIAFEFRKANLQQMRAEEKKQ